MRRTTATGRIRPLGIAIVAALALHGSPTAADPPISHPGHALLQRFAGDWAFEKKAPPNDGPDAEPVSSGTVRGSTLGEFFAVLEWSGDAYGTPFESVQTVGYDADRGAYVGAWVDSLTSYRWQFAGPYDERTRELVVSATGPSPGGGTTRYRERYRFESPDSIAVVAQRLSGDTWVTFQTTSLTRIDTNATESEEPMKIHYLEIVTPDVDAFCAAHAAVHGAEFGEPVPELGGARTADRAGGGTIGVRAPMHASEEPVTRPYYLVDDIEAAVKAAVAAGAQVAHPPLEIPGRGTFAVLIQAGVQQGLWQI